MRRSNAHLTVALALLLASVVPMLRATGHKQLEPAFHTSDRCLACHNGLKTPAGDDVSIGFAWRASIMANSARDPYWQASVRREDIDHPEARSEIEDGCADCHMPIARYQAKLQGRPGEVFAHLPFGSAPRKRAS
jgi:nitrate/TMAO reductase-like tetraheme cytochrome c subunit